MQPLAALLRTAALSSSGQQGDTGVVQAVCRLLHVLASVRGYKTVVRFFPHEAADLERVLQVRQGGPVEKRGGCAAGRACRGMLLLPRLAVNPLHHVALLPVHCRTGAGLCHSRGHG